MVTVEVELVEKSLVVGMPCIASGDTGAKAGDSAYMTVAEIVEIELQVVVMVSDRGNWRELVMVQVEVAKAAKVEESAKVKRVAWLVKAQKADRAEESWGFAALA
jgi:hypothetical protein